MPDGHPSREQAMAQIEVVRRASKTGVIVGDHRLDFDIITPKLDEMLNEKKRRLIGRKLATAMLRSAADGPNDSSGLKPGATRRSGLRRTRFRR